MSERLVAARAAALDLMAQPVANQTEVDACKAGRFDTTPVGSLYDDEPPLIARADPATLISTGILCEILVGRGARWVTYDADERLLRIDGANRRVIYRIGGPVNDARSTFCMRWPD